MALLPYGRHGSGKCSGQILGRVSMGGVILRQLVRFGDTVAGVPRHIVQQKLPMMLRLQVFDLLCQLRLDAFPFLGKLVVRETGWSGPIFAVRQDVDTGKEALKAERDPMLERILNLAKG